MVVITSVLKPNREDVVSKGTQGTQSLIIMLYQCIESLRHLCSYSLLISIYNTPIDLHRTACVAVYFLDV